MAASLINPPDRLTPLPIWRAFLARMLEKQKRNGADRDVSLDLTIRDAKETIQELENSPELQARANRIWAANHPEESATRE